MENKLFLIWVCFRVMARIECLACISNAGFQRHTWWWRWCSTHLPFTRTTCAVSCFTCACLTSLELCFSTMDLDYKLEPRPCLNSHMFPSCLYGDLFCYPTIWSVNCIFSYCTVVYLDVDAICIYCFCLHYSCTPSLPSAVCINFYSPVCSLRFAFCTDQIVIVIHVMYIELKKIMLWSIFFCVNLF